MAKIPNYLIKKVERHNVLVEKAANLESEIEEWYEKQLGKHDDIASGILDEDFANIKCDMSATYVSLENISHNLDLIGNGTGCIKDMEPDMQKDY